MEKEYEIHEIVISKRKNPTIKLDIHSTPVRLSEVVGMKKL